MKILFDPGVPKLLQTHLVGHQVTRAYQLGWARKKNGELLTLAENAAFEMMVTTDQRTRHQQDLGKRRLAIFVLGRGNWPEIKPYTSQIAARINTISEPGVYFFPIPPVI